LNLSRYEIDNCYLEHEEPVRSSLLALRKLILSFDKEITEAWKYKMPFFCIKGKMFCYVGLTRKRIGLIGIVEDKKVIHPDLQMENRSRMKIIPFDPTRDLPIRTIRAILKMTLDLYTQEPFQKK